MGPSKDLIQTNEARHGGRISPITAGQIREGGSRLPGAEDSSIDLVSGQFHARHCLQQVGLVAQEEGFRNLIEQRYEDVSRITRHLTFP
jgi:hypothetical protein